MDVFEGHDSAFVDNMFLEVVGINEDGSEENRFKLSEALVVICVDVALVSVASFLRAVVSDRPIVGKATVFDINGVDVTVVAVCVELNFEFVLHVEAEVEDRV